MATLTTDPTLPAKPPYQSKTLWINAILAVAALTVPAASGFIALHPEIFTALFAGVNILLRLVTKTQISID